MSEAININGFIQIEFERREFFVESLLLFAEEFYKETGQHPKAFVLGAKEFLQLKAEIRESYNRIPPKLHSERDFTEINGIPVRTVAMHSFISLETDPERSDRFLKIEKKGEVWGE